MAQYVLVMTHPPDQCPTANSTVRKLWMGGATELPKLAKRLGIKFVAGPLISTEHKAVAIVEAEKVEAVRNLIIEGGFIQWNSVEVLPCVTMEEAFQEVEKLKPIY